MQQLDPARVVQVLRFGREQSPVICIDQCWQDPAGLLAEADSAAFIGAGTSYPGLRAPAPSWYVPALLAGVAPVVNAVFGAAPEDDLDTCAYSLVTTEASRLRAIQRIPHFDGPETRRVAYLHYLCEPGQGGTSFYRHRASGHETVTAERVSSYLTGLMAELKESPPDPQYANGDSAQFERIGGVDAVFNRLVIYKGNALHSGDIGASTVLSEDPRRGRLTINGFGFLREASPVANSESQ